MGPRCRMEIRRAECGEPPGRESRRLKRESEYVLSKMKTLEHSPGHGSRAMAINTHSSTDSTMVAPPPARATPPAVFMEDDGECCSIDSD